LSIAHDTLEISTHCASEYSEQCGQYSGKIFVSAQSQKLRTDHFLRDLPAGFAFFAGALVFLTFAVVTFAFFDIAVTDLAVFFFADAGAAFFDLTAAVFATLLFFFALAAGFAETTVFDFFAGAFAALAFFTAGFVPGAVMPMSGTQLPSANCPMDADDDGAVAVNPDLQLLAARIQLTPLN
jgi:hypothetical protein